jgi:hypothetical protein
MSSQQNTTNEIELTPQQDDYVAYCAVGGILPQEDGFGKKMTLEEYAAKLQVDRTTLWRWRTTIPDFWDRVSKKRADISGKARLTAVWNGVAMKAATGNAECAKLFLANFDPNFRMPMEKIQHEVGNSWAALLESHLKPNQNITIEAEIVNDQTTSN